MRLKTLLKYIFLRSKWEDFSGVQVRGAKGGQRDKDNRRQIRGKLHLAQFRPCSVIKGNTR